MIDRRQFIATGTALGLMGSGAAAAQGEALSDQFQPRLVPVAASIAAGEVHVDPNRFALYWTLGAGQAMRYSVGVGRTGLYESGVFTVGAKREWPTWTPTPDMIEREPEKYEQFADGVPGGPENPLGARALYLYDANQHDTYLRIHGTNAPGTIGQAVSNGCARLINDEIIELYKQVPVGTRVFLYPKMA